MPKFTVKDWRKVRPESAKGLGVAEAIGNIDKAFKTALNQMTAAEVKTAREAVEEMEKALGKADKAIAADKKNKDRSAAIKLVDDWQKECKKLLSDLSNNVPYDVKVGRVQAAFQADYDRVKGEVDKYHAEAQAHVRAGTQPDDKEIQHYFTAVRDGNKICTKQHIKALNLPEAKQVKESDVVMPDDIKMTKAKLALMEQWCTDFAKAAKRGARAAAGGLVDTKAADKAVKAVMDGYTKVEADMKPLIKAANAQAKTTKQIADAIKAAIAKGNTDDRTFKALAANLKLLLAQVDKVEADMKAVGDTWRTGASKVGKLVAAAHATPGYDKDTHGKILVDRMQANQMGIRRVTVPVAESRRQIDRARRLLSESTSHRGYASAF